MICVKNFPTYLLKLYITFCVLIMCYEISKIEECVYRLYVNNWEQELTNYFSAPFPALKVLNRNDRASLKEQSLQGYKIWRSLVDDLVDFDRNNSLNMTMYPLYIKASNTERINSANPPKVTRPLYWNGDVNALMGCQEVEEDNCSNKVKKEKLLDNSFYDMHLNTAVNTSTEYHNKCSPLKKDAFLQSLYNNSCDELGFYNGNLAEIGKQVILHILKFKTWGGG